MSRDDFAMADEKAVMFAEIALQPEFVRNSIAATVARVGAALTEHAGRGVSSLIIIGCGDSYFAGLAARAYGMALTRRWIEPLGALEFSRYLVPALSPDALVIGVSNSGTVARTIEGVRLGRERGAWTFAVTAKAESPLAQSAETLVQVDAVPNIKQRADGTKLVTPGSITYTASLLGICAATIALGEHLGSLTRPQVRCAIAEFERVADWMAEADATARALAPQLAATFTRERTTVILGGGPNVATAHYGAAKWYEALQWPAHAAEMEEWAHQQYFFTGSRTDTIVLLPRGGAHDRGLEQLRAARDMASRTIVIGERGDVEAERSADVFIPLPAGIPEALTPFVYKLPFEYLAAHIAAARRIDFFGFGDPHRQAVNFRQIFDSSHASAHDR
jgi:glucosamine--fructose-6-phosphate aminotransferase (isomerizing)